MSIMKITLDKTTNEKLKKQAKEFSRSIKKHVQQMIKEGIEDVELDKIPAGFRGPKRK